MEMIRENQAAVEKELASKSGEKDPALGNAVAANRARTALTSHELARQLRSLKPLKSTAVFKCPPADGKGGLYPVTRWEFKGGNVILSTDTRETLLSNDLERLLRGMSEKSVVLYDDHSGSEPVQIQEAVAMDGKTLKAMGFDGCEAGVVLT
jgi:hypothetical protein